MLCQNPNAVRRPNDGERCKDFRSATARRSALLNNDADKRWRAVYRTSLQAVRLDARVPPSSLLSVLSLNASEARRPRDFPSREQNGRQGDFALRRRRYLIVDDLDARPKSNMDIVAHAAPHDHVLFVPGRRRDMRRITQAAAQASKRIHRAIVGIVGAVQNGGILQRRAANEQTNIRFSLLHSGRRFARKQNGFDSWRKFLAADASVRETSETI